MRLFANIDGASRGNPGPASVGVHVVDEDGKTVRAHCRAIGTATNNVAEYTALIDALKIAKELGAASLSVRSDSQLLVRQVTGVYKIKNAVLFDFVKEIHALKAGLDFTIEHVRREQNTKADALANEALDNLKQV